MTRDREILTANCAVDYGGTEAAPHNPNDGHILIYNGNIERAITILQRITTAQTRSTDLPLTVSTIPPDLRLYKCLQPARAFYPASR
jgi:hypothetical protein